MIKFFTIVESTLLHGGDQMSENRPAKVLNLPTTVKGFCYHDDDGEEFVVVNARHSREQNRITYDHECRHIIRGDMYEPGYTEYKEEQNPR